MVPFLTLNQVAERLHTPLATVRYWLAVGKLKGFKPGRHVLIKEADLVALVEGAELGVVRATRVRRTRTALAVKVTRKGAA